MSLIEMLDERGMSQRDLARATGITPQRINAWVKGVRDPGIMALDTARRVSDALGVTLDEFQSRL